MYVRMDGCFHVCLEVCKPASMGYGSMIHIHMCVYLNVCTCVYGYVRMYVYAYVNTYVCLNVCKHASIDRE